MPRPVGHLGGQCDDDDDGGSRIPVLVVRVIFGRHCGNFRPDVVA